MKRTTSIYLAAAIAASMLLTACGSARTPGASEQDLAVPQDDVAAALSEGYREPLIGADAVIEKTADHLTFAVLPSKGGQLIYTLSHPQLVDNNLEFAGNGIIDGSVEVDEAEDALYRGMEWLSLSGFCLPGRSFCERRSLFANRCIRGE